MLCPAPSGLENLFISQRQDVTCLLLGNGLSCPHPSGQPLPQGHSPLAGTPGCTFCRTEMPWTVWLERVSPARDAGSAVRLMHTPGFSWHVLSELLSSGTKICAGGASSADSHPPAPLSGHRSLLCPSQAPLERRSLGILPELATRLSPSPLLTSLRHTVITIGFLGR